MLFSSVLADVTTVAVQAKTTDSAVAAKAREAQAAADLAAQAALRAPAPPSRSAAAAGSSSGAPAWSCERILAAVTQGSIYANEASEHAGLRRDVRLRTYQKQTIGFMLDRERSAEPSSLGTSFVRPEGQCSTAPMPVGVRGGYVADEVGMGKTLCALSVILANPAPPAGATAPMLADGVRITVWYAQGGEATAAQEAAAPACPQLGVVRWSNYEGMMVRFDEVASLRSDRSVRHTRP